MFGSNILEVAIGLIFIFLLYSLLATAINEAIASYLGLRAKNLKKAIERMLDDDSGKTFFSDKFYKQPLIKYLGEPTFFGKVLRKPAYLTSQNFSKNVVDLLKKLDDGKNVEASALERIKSGIEKIPASETKEFIKSLMNDANHDVEKFKTLLEQWYNDTMERASGWYKRKVQFMIFIIGFALAIIFNVDSIELVNKLSKDPESRKLVVEMATTYINKHPQGIDIVHSQATKKDSLAINNMDSLQVKHDSIVTFAESLLRNDIEKADNLLSAGWGNFNGAKGKWARFKYVIHHLCSIKKLLGFLITTFAISLGAPFWFDLLSKLVKIRSGGKKPEEDKPIK